PITRICASVSKPCQTIFFSATRPTEMKSLSDEFLHNQVTIKIESKNITADTVSQRAIMVSDALKRETLGKLLEDVDGDQVLVFVGTKRRADALGQFLSAQDIQADVLHGDMRQNIRSKVLRKFKSGQLQVLVATDVAARGIDVVGLNWVINYDLPQMPEIYVHRIGRTGRAQQSGRAISLCSPTQRALLAAISRHVNGVIDIVNAQGEAIEIDSLQTPNRQRRKGGGRPFGAKCPGQPKGGRRRGDGEFAPRRRKHDAKPRPERTQNTESSWHPADTNDRPEQGKKRTGSAKPKNKFKSDKFKSDKFKSDKFGDDSVKSDRFKKKRDTKKPGRDNFDHESAPRPNKAKNDKPKAKNKPFRGQSSQSREQTDRSAFKTSSKGKGRLPGKNGSGGQKDGGKLRLKRPKNAKKSGKF
ncbi:MAG: DEAD/DEAH box helicase, partial [Pseudomonadota bacterium]|nr:DEAD/DEAH box helicase [Pseudomonadota bacterium]